jgi:transcriptional regulator with XRE-family HTH domain
MASVAKVFGENGPARESSSLFGRPVNGSYRRAVADCIRAVKARHGLTNVALADYLGCSKDTVANAENENGNLDAVTLLNIAFVFGEGAISPVRELYLCRESKPLTVEEEIDDVIGSLAGLKQKLRLGR